MCLCQLKAVASPYTPCMLAETEAMRTFAVAVSAQCTGCHSLPLHVDPFIIQSFLCLPFNGKKVQHVNHTLS
jgi:hypothetical protein